MSYSKKRTIYNNEWPNKKIEFSAHKDFLKLLNSKGITNILKPIQLPLITDIQFQRLLSFKIDIYEQLPNRPDLAFDLSWRTFEAYSTYISKKLGWSVSKKWKIFNKATEDIFSNQLGHSSSLDSAFILLKNSIPLQTTEFLIKRIFESSTPGISSHQGKIIERVKDSLGDALYDEMKIKYGSLTPENQRKAGMLLRILISGQEIQLNSKKFQLDNTKIIKFLINSIMFTYRNERFHGDSFSPFKSSRTKIKTYAHSFYLLLCSYFFLCQLIYKDQEDQFELDQIAETLKDNLVRFNLVFENQLKK